MRLRETGKQAPVRIFRDLAIPATGARRTRATNCVQASSLYATATNSHQIWLCGQPHAEPAAIGNSGDLPGWILRIVSSAQREPVWGQQITGVSLTAGVPGSGGNDNMPWPLAEVPGPPAERTVSDD
jgi:hypothetical protein